MSLRKLCFKKKTRRFEIVITDKKPPKNTLLVLRPGMYYEGHNFSPIPFSIANLDCLDNICVVKKLKQLTPNTGGSLINKKEAQMAKKKAMAKAKPKPAPKKK